MGVSDLSGGDPAKVEDGSRAVNFCSVLEIVRLDDKDFGEEINDA